MEMVKISLRICDPFIYDDLRYITDERHNMKRHNKKTDDDRKDFTGKMDEKQHRNLSFTSPLSLSFSLSISFLRRTGYNALHC